MLSFPSKNSFFLLGMVLYTHSPETPPFPCTDPKHFPRDFSASKMASRFVSSFRRSEEPSVRPFLWRARPILNAMDTLREPDWLLRYAS
jgi:hypothetical protein